MEHSEIDMRLHCMEDRVSLGTDLKAGWLNNLVNIISEILFSKTFTIINDIQDLGILFNNHNKIKVPLSIIHSINLF